MNKIKFSAKPTYNSSNHSQKFLGLVDTLKGDLWEQLC